MVVFSGFGSNGSNKRNYNYISHFSNYNADRLYILDNWGCRGSYYLMENGNYSPLKITSEIIEQFIFKNNYNTLIFCGTSKGGSAAVYYGLKYNANYIISGACQYHIGDYIKNYPDIMKGMIGMTKLTEDKIRILNSSMYDMIKQKISYFTGKIVLIYSEKEKEKTYQIELKDLIKDINACSYHLERVEEDFINHSEIGVHFINYMNSFLNRLITAKN